MTTEELKERVRDVGFVSYGHHKIEIEYRGKSYTCITTNMPATDRLRSDLEERKVCGFYTLKGALMALYRECKRKNGLK